VTRAAYRVQEFAEALGVSERTAARWVASGRVRSLKVGRCRRIPASELARIVGDERGVAAGPVDREAVRLLKRARGVGNV
jgi:excisionase family DNA binding protein